MRCLRLQEVINESKLLARKLNEANQKINRKDSCLTRMQVNSIPLCYLFEDWAFLFSSLTPQLTQLYK